MSFPITYDVDYVEKRSRLTTFFRYLLSIPVFIVAFIYLMIAGIAVFIAWFVLLLTGKWPAGLYDFVAKVVRYTGRAGGYYCLLTDEYPGFGLDDDPAYPVHVGIPEPKEKYSRLRVLLRCLLSIPVAIVAYVFGIVGNIVVFFAWIVIVITGKAPKGLFDTTVGVQRYTTRAFAYYWLLVEDWPPMSFGD